MKNLKLLLYFLTAFTAMLSCSKTNDLVGAINKQTDELNPVKTTNATASTKVVIGYIPAWENVQTVMNNTDLSIVTHINIAFFSPNSSGAMISGGQPVCSDATSSDITFIVNKAHQNGVKVLASLQGGVVPSCSGNLAKLLKPANRANLITNLKAFANYYNLDGIDIDIEGSLLATIKTANNYTPFIHELRTALHPLGKLVTAASAGYNSAMIPHDSFQYLDFVNVMSYDNGWGGTGNHSTYTDALTHIQNFLDAGCPSEKMSLGLPFYGYLGNVGTGTETSFKSIVSQYPTAANVDSYAGYQYNGIKTIEKKTSYAAQHIGGVMIWDLSQDVSGSNSLLKAIGRKIN
jgi:chitinase